MQKFRMSCNIPNYTRKLVGVPYISTYRVYEQHIFSSLYSMRSEPINCIRSCVPSTVQPSCAIRGREVGFFICVCTYMQYSTGESYVQVSGQKWPRNNERTTLRYRTRACTQAHVRIAPVVFHRLLAVPGWYSTKYLVEYHYSKDLRQCVFSGIPLWPDYGRFGGMSEFGGIPLNLVEYHHIWWNTIKIHTCIWWNTTNAHAYI